MSPLGPPPGDPPRPGSPTPDPRKPRPDWAPRPAAPRPSPPPPPAAVAPASGAPAASLPERMKANKAIAGKVCPGCKGAIALGEDVWNCRACGTPHHQPCREQGGGCLGDTCAAKDDATTAPGAETKACPYCGEQVLKTARVCKHCREVLSATLRAQRARTAGAGVSTAGRTALICGIAGLFICQPVLGPIAIFKGREAQRYPDQAGMGTAGFVMGIIDIAVFVLYIVVTISRG